MAHSKHPVTVLVTLALVEMFAACERSFEERSEQVVEEAGTGTDAPLVLEKAAAESRGSGFWETLQNPRGRSRA